jgi:hypothetical protein
MGILRREDPDQTPNEFWKEIEEKHGGNVRFHTFVRFIGRSQSSMENLPGLLYIINNVAHFEDFEKDNMLMRLVNRKSKYTKTEFSFPLSSIEKLQVVSKNQAVNCITGVVAGSDLKPMGGLARMLFSPVYHVYLENGTSIFFEQVMDEKKFLKELQKIE